MENRILFERSGPNTCIRGFVDQHGVHGHDVGSSEALHILQNLNQEQQRNQVGIFCSVELAFLSERTRRPQFSNCTCGKEQ